MMMKSMKHTKNSPSNRSNRRSSAVSSAKTSPQSNSSRRRSTVVSNKSSSENRRASLLHKSSAEVLVDCLKQGSYQNVRDILEHPSFKDEYVNSTNLTPLSGCTLLGFAVFSNNLNATRAMIDDPRCDVLQKGECGRTVFDFFTQANVAFAEVAFNRLKIDIRMMEARQLPSERTKLAKARKLMRWWAERQVDWKREIVEAKQFNRRLSASYAEQRRQSLVVSKSKESIAEQRRQSLVVSKSKESIASTSPRTESVVAQKSTSTESVVVQKSPTKESVVATARKRRSCIMEEPFRTVFPTCPRKPKRAPSQRRASQAAPKRSATPAQFPVCKRDRSRSPAPRRSTLERPFQTPFPTCARKPKLPKSPSQAAPSRSATLQPKFPVCMRVRSRSPVPRRSATLDVPRRGSTCSVSERMSAVSLRPSLGSVQSVRTSTKIGDGAPTKSRGLTSFLEAKNEGDVTSILSILQTKKMLARVNSA